MKPNSTGFIQFVVVFVLLIIPFSVYAQNKELDHLFSEANKAVKKAKWDEADSLYRQYIVIFNEQGYTKNYQYTEILNYLARRAMNMGNPDQAIELQKEIVEVRRTAPDCTSTQWAISLADLASFYAQKTQYQQAIEIGEQALDALKKKLGDSHHSYCVALVNQASFYAGRGQENDYQKAVEICEQALKKMKKGTSEYAKALNSLVIFYTQTGNLTAANTIAQKARKEAKKRLEEDGVGYATVLNNQATRLAKAGNYKEAISYALTAQELFQTASGTNTVAYATLLGNLATFYAHQQDYENVIKLLTEALAILEKILGKEHPSYIRYMSDLSVAYKGLGDMEKADEMAHASDRLSQTLDEQDNSKYAQSLTKQASVFTANGNYWRAIEHLQRAADIYKSRCDSTNLAFVLSELANNQLANGQKELGLQTARQVQDIYDRRGEISPKFAQALNNIAIFYYNIHDYVQAAKRGKLSIDIYRQTADTMNALYARVMANNALFLYAGDSLAQAVQMAQQSLNLHNIVLGDDHPDNIPLLYNLAIYQSKGGLKEESHETYKKALKLQADEVRTNFLYLTSQEREKYWNQKSFVFKLASLLAYLDRDNGRLNIEAYNSLLFSKGILLNSDIDFKNLVHRSGNQSLLQQYNELGRLRKEEEELFKQPVTEQTQTNAKLIKEQMFNLERALVKGCKEYGQFTESLSISAEQVADALNNDEVAIEFTDFYIEGRGRVYVAFMLRHGQTEPTLVRLFDEKDLHRLTYLGGSCDFFQALKQHDGINEIYNDPRLGSLVWKEIVAKLTGVRKIYFSPTTLFYQLGIEYLLANDTQRIGELYSVYRLSSTKSLVNTTSEQNIKKAVIYGGLEYEMDLAQLKYQHEHISTGVEYLTSMTNMNESILDDDSERTIDSLSVRGSVSYLEGTLHEVENIAEQLMQNNVNTKVYTGLEGVEETFKMLSGSEQDLIHIATHGFYFSEQEIKNSGVQLAFLDKQQEHLENVLNYSGLLFSGSNYILRGNKLPDNIENGVLTAREIAQMDLGHVGLIVLSACQTGLGEIKEDGVFGIQRGFKKAGAQSLLMSLWKVNDYATDMMMSKFYEFLMDGHSRHEAFSMAQQAVRESEFSAPYFWASFVLLDAK